jgi:hypothetical protein
MNGVISEQQDDTILLPKRRRRRWLYWLLLFWLLLAGAGYYTYTVYWLPSQAAAPNEEAAPATVTVRRGDRRLTVEGVGALIAANEVGLGFRTTGVVRELLVQPGDLITAGQTLAALLDANQALREIGPASYAVFVALPNGELEMRPVEVGLQDFVAAGNQAGAGREQNFFQSAYLTNQHEGALPVTMQLSLGTLRLEDTDQAVAPEQAPKLLPLWQALQSGAIQNSAERNAVYKPLIRLLQERLGQP